MIEMRRNTAPPIAPAKITTTWFFDELLLYSGADRGPGRGEGEAELFRSTGAGF